MALPQCKHRSASLAQAILYSFTLALVFVISLYAFIPPSVRLLPRDNKTHMKWRSGVVVAVAAAGVVIYPLLFCEYLREADEMILWYRCIGIKSGNILEDLKAILHVAILYAGSFATRFIRVYHYARILQIEGKQRNKNIITNNNIPVLPKLKHIVASANRLWVHPIRGSIQTLFLEDETFRWIILRNLLIAPASEEVIFRACIIAPLLTSHNDNDVHLKLTTTEVCWIAPLFFGVAHLHHFHEQYRRLSLLKRTKQNILRLIVGVLFQFTYTTLFGAYASHLFIRTGSLLSVIFVHIFCNYMGLPEVSFASPTSGLHCYRWMLWCAYLIGIVLFIKGFESTFLFPEKSVLSSLLR